jgi:hypothetical protein
MQSILSTQDFTWADERTRHLTHPHLASPLVVEPRPVFSIEQAYAMSPFNDSPFDFSLAQSNVISSDSTMFFGGDAPVLSPTENVTSPNTDSYFTSPQGTCFFIFVDP